MATDLDKTGGFYFSVIIDGEECAFEEVSGQGTTFAVETTIENGNYTKFTPGVKHDNLILKRGMASSKSILAQWCAAMVTNNLNTPITTKDITISLSPNFKINHTRIFYNAYPVSWSASQLQQGDVLTIEEVEFAYSSFNNLTAIKITAYEDEICARLMGGFETLFDPASFKNNGKKEISFGITSKKDISDRVARIKKIVYNYSGDIHEPNYLKIEWNGQIFKGRLDSLNINYISFKKDGTPLQALIELSVT